MTEEARAFAPGRVEILGNYTDLIGGHVLAATLDRGITAVARRGEGAGMLRCRSARLREEFAIDLADPTVDPERPWSRYVVGVARELGVTMSVDIEIESDLPPGAGLASSAALTVAVARALSQLSGAPVDGVELARLCRAVEHRHVGVECGVLDPMCAVSGVDAGALLLDATTLKVTPVALPDHAALVLIRSRVGRELTRVAYNQRRRELEEARDRLGAESLLDVPAAELDSLDEPLAGRARHVTGEHRRVGEATRALAEGDVATLGELMLESHDSSRRNFENSCVELDCLVELARYSPGCHGARLTGAGFGGATVSLIDRRKLDRFRASMTREVIRHFGFAPDLMVITFP